MKLNKNLKNTLKKLGVKHPDNCISWCLGMYYGLKPTNILITDMTLLVEKNMVERSAKGLKFNFNLFDTEEIEEGVQTYLELFRERRLFSNEETTKTRIKFIMNKFGYSMIKILELAKYHLDNEKFPRRPHYFLFKGRGKDCIYPIKDTEIEMLHNNEDSQDDFL